MKSSERYAMAFDLGTTTIAAALLDRVEGKRLATAGCLNPQREFGADVISRLEAACASPAALKRMARLVNAELERLALQLLNAAGVPAASLSSVAIAGNPAMEHLLLELPVKSIAFPPYRPLFSAGKTVRTVELGWKTDVNAYVFPLPGGFVGGDLVAFLFGVDPNVQRSPFNDPRLFLDLGTNGEIALTVADRLYSTSAAAGPAFEGGNLECGMAALAGAISGVRIEGEKLSLSVIGGGAPAGLCGSAVIETISALLREGILDETGRLLTPEEIPTNLANRVIARADGLAFLLYRDADREIVLSQEDIRQVQLAKGAIRAGMEVLFDRSGIDREALTEVVLTGSFGAKLTPEGLKYLGIFPGRMEETCRFVPEGALTGVESACTGAGGFAAVDRLAARIKVVPLSGTPVFEKHFIEQMNFPKVSLQGFCKSQS